MNPIVRLLAVVAILLAVARPGSVVAGSVRCAPDAVAVGPLCVDKWEASVWSIPPENDTLVAKVKKGRASLAHLTAGGATQINAMTPGTCLDVAYPATFPANGNWTVPLYAVSVPGVSPTTCTTWFQAEQACRLSGKRLLTNAEWQAAAAGTPDPGAADDQETTCATATGSPLPGILTGSRSACVSRWGTYDMVGNAWEWVSEWTLLADACGAWGPSIGDDMVCAGVDGDMAPATPVFRRVRGDRRAPRLRRVGFRRVESVSTDPHVPAGIIRGGNFGIDTRGGVFAYYAGANPSAASRSISFRCAR
jgi:formylglycine-generating enzyme required for sulfatase activity